MKSDELKSFLDEQVEVYNQPAFIVNDPISIPRAYTLRQDIEIAGFFSSILAWGQRKTIISKCRELLDRMDNRPYDFICNHTASELKAFKKFKHRTFNETDCLYFIRFLRSHYKKYGSLESAFLMDSHDQHVGNALINFHERFFSLEEYPLRTKKHVATPARKSACKRINMFLRWMVRKDNKGVDFGIWNSIKPSQLVCPCDLHVERVARELNLIKRKPMDWFTALELTGALRKFDANDPVKYDFALFGLGLEGKY